MGESGTRVGEGEEAWSMYMNMYMCMYMCVYMCMCMCMCLCLCVCVCMCMCMYIMYMYEQQIPLRDGPSSSATPATDPG